MSEREQPFTGMEVSRILGRHGGAAPDEGPLLIVTVAVHGNEPSGVRAAWRVLEALQSRRPPFSGELLVLAGNLGALRAGVRYVDRDLNRLFLPRKIARLREHADLSAEPAEAWELLALLDEIEPRLEQARAAGRRVYLVDLHTSSADGCPFVTTGDTLRSREFALRFPTPLILGLEEQLDGSLIEYFGEQGIVTLAGEAGQHHLPSSVDHHEAMLWHALVAAGAVAQQDISKELARHSERLGRVTAGVQRVMEVRHRHRISPYDGFRMRPGFENFQPVRKGQLLAEDHRGPIRAREAGIVLLPLYQGLGEDGFFLGRAVGGFWLRLSAGLRLLGLPSRVHWLPGIRRLESERALVMQVDTRIARFYPLELFLMLGYRKIRERGPYLTMRRRRWDLSAPW